MMTFTEFGEQVRSLAGPRPYAYGYTAEVTDYGAGAIAEYRCWIDPIRRYYS